MNLLLTVIINKTEWNQTLCIFYWLYRKCHCRSPLLLHPINHTAIKRLRACRLCTWFHSMMTSWHRNDFHMIDFLKGIHWLRWCSWLALILNLMCQNGSPLYQIIFPSRVFCRIFWPCNWLSCGALCCGLKHWGRDNMSNAFSWMKMLKFHWSLFLRVLLTIFQHWFG